MGSPTLPAAPAAPDYAAANREGIQTDIATLPLRNQINQAAQLGQKITYTDPVTGAQKEADFTGMGNAAAAKQAADILAQSNADLQRQQLALRQELGTKNAAQTAEEIRAADPTGAKLRDSIFNRTQAELDLGSVGATAPSQAIADAAGRLSNRADNVPGNDNRLASLYDRSAAAFNTGTSDMGTNAQNLALQQLAANRLGTRADDMGTNATLAGLQGIAANRLGTRATDDTNRSRINSVYDQATRLPTAFGDINALALTPALASAVQDYQLGGKLNDAELRQTTDNVRAGQAARGNYLGDAAALQEALQQNAASDAKKQQRLQNLMAIQSQAFGQSDALRNESQAAALARISQLAGLQGQSFGQEQGLRQEDRDSAAQQIGTMSNLAQQVFGNNQSLRQEDRDSAAQQIGTLSNLGQQLFTNNQGLRNEGRNAVAQNAGMLGSLAGQDFGQGQQAYATGLNAAQAAFTGAQGMANDQRAARQEGFGYDQQRLANASSAALGAPITNQFGALGGAQNGAVGFTPIAYQGAGQLNNNAGAQGAGYAQGNYGTQAGIWNTQANIAAQGNPWMSLLGNAAGAASGAAAAKLI